MVNGVAFGQRSPGEYGLWVSKPGVNVLAAGDDQLLLSSGRKSLQVVASGIVSASAGGSYGISWPNLGFYPAIVVGSARFGNARVTHASLTTATITAGTAQDFFRWTHAGTFPNPPYAISWAVLNVPAS